MPSYFLLDSLLFTIPRPIYSTSPLLADPLPSPPYPAPPLPPATAPLTQTLPLLVTCFIVRCSIKRYIPGIIYLGKYFLLPLQNTVIFEPRIE